MQNFRKFQGTQGHAEEKKLAAGKKTHKQKAPEDAADWKWEKINRRTALLLLNLKRM